MSEPALAYDLPDAARMLGVSSRTLRRLVEKGQMGTVRIGRLRRFPKAELDRYLAENLTVCPTAQKIVLSGGSASPTKAAAELASLLGHRISGKPRHLKLVAVKPSGA